MDRTPCRVAHSSRPYRDEWGTSALLLASILLCSPVLYAQTPDGSVPSKPTAVTVAPAQGGTLRGTITAATTGKAAAVPLPGVAVIATNTLTGKKYATTTGVDGAFTMAIPRNGRYVLRAEFAAFAPQTQEVILKDATLPAPANFSLELASRAAATATQQAAAASPAAALARGLNSLRLSGGAGDALDASASPSAEAATGALPSLSGLGDTTESVAVSGQTGQTNALGGVSEDDLRSRVEDAVAQARASGQIPPGAGSDTNAIVSVIGGILGSGGGFGPGGGGGRGGRGGGGGGGFGGGNFRNFNPAQPHGSIFYQGGNSALDSAPWSPTLLPQINPAAYSNRFGVTLAGSPYIPGLTKPNTKQFVFLNLTGQKNLNAFLPNPVRVPTDAERNGDFSNSFQVVNGVLTPVTLYDPATGQPLTYMGRANVLNPARRTAQALALLQYYPEPNIITADPTAYNYQTISNAGSNNVAINARYVRQLGASAGNSPFGGAGRGGGGGRNANANAKPTLHQNINIGYNFSHAAADQRNIFLPLGGANESDGNGVTLGYVISFGRLSNNATLSWNRSSAETRNYFTDTQNNPSQTAGIAVPNQAGTLPDPRFYNGLPALTITNFAPLSNTTPSQLINQTISYSDFVSYRHKKHNYRFGFDIRRVHADQIGGDNPLGRFTFTGLATAAPVAQASQNSNTASGSGFADFLLGLPQSTQLQAGLYKIYLRENVYDGYAQDDYRVTANLTLNLGLRYEYFGPYTEKNNRLVNLDHNANYTAFAAVQPDALSPFGGQVNRSVVNPDDTMFSPRIGVAYRPKFLPKISRDTVLRGGYGINFNTGQYAQFARSLSHQAPFADTETNTLTSGCTTRTPGNAVPSLTLAHGFGCSTLYQLQNNFAVDRNYRLGMVQVYNLNLQRTIPLNIVLNVGYNGSYGTNLDFLGTPNANSLGSTVAGVAPFDLDTSIATSRSNQLVISAQKRQTHGIALGATYTFQHAITNASGVGGVSGTPAQNFFNPAAEFGNASFDRRHQLTGNWVTELPFGPNRAYFNKGGLASHLLDGFSLSGTFTFASGQYFTPQYSGSIAEAAAGTTYTQRPDRNYATASTGPGTYKTFFNTGAFTAPGTQTTASGQLLTLPGTAAPNSIEGPGTVQVSAALARTISLGDTRSFEARVTATNVFNTVQYSGINTTQNNANFGQVTSAAAMRALQVQARYRF